MLLLPACVDTELAAVSATPGAGPLSGYQDLRFELEGIDPASVTAATLGGVRLIGLSADGTALAATTQGAPDAGPAELVLVSGEGEHRFPGVYTFDAPADPAFDRLVGIGASFTMGVQNGVPSDHAQLASPGRVLAEQAGAFYSLPLLVPGLFPELATSDIGPAPGCEIPNIADFVADASTEVILTLSDDDGFAFYPGRVDPDLVPRDLAVGGNRVDMVVNGSEAFELNFLAHLVFDPYGGLSDVPPQTQLSLAVAAEPTMVVSFDLLGNDLIWSVVVEDVIDPSLATPVEELRAPLGTLLAELDQTGAEIFIANLPDPTVLGLSRQKEARMRASDEYTGEEVDTIVAEVRQAASDYNALLAELSAPYPRVHIVDVAARVSEVAASGMQLGDETVEISLVGGFISLDGLHFSNTGYGLLADSFVLAINDALGTSLSRPDLEAIHADDPLGAEALRASGFDVSACGI